MESNKYPLYINGENRGEVRMKRDGLYTLIECHCGGIAQPTELWMWGEGKNIYIGRLLPDNSGASLTKKYSRSEMSDFPERIDRFCDRPTDMEAPRDDHDDRWRRHCDGTMTRHEGSERIIAIPSQLRRATAGVRIMRIDGREYLIFRY